MTVSKLFSVLLLSILIAISSVYTQESSAFKWGIGVASPFVQSQYVIPAYPNTVISIPMFFSRQFKLEPFISYSDFTDEQKREDETPYTLDVNYQNVAVGVGLFYSKPINTTRLHFGVQFGYVRSKYEYKYVYPNDANITESNGDGYLISPIIGGEYFFSEHFSLGGQVHFEWYSVSSDETTSSEFENRKYANSTTRKNTLGLIAVRFYFN